jgi:gliding motility-associated-like protein
VSATSSSITNLCSSNYSVVVSNVNYCNLSDTISISLLAQTEGFTVEATPNNSTVTICDSVQLNASGASFYTWSPSLGLSCDTCSNPFASPAVTTTYIVTGLDTNGCFATAEVIVEVNENDSCLDDCELYTPKSFTPNGDGINEKFCPLTICTFEQYEFLIFNRWGELIFKTSNQTDKWDGKFRGSDCPVGVYVYLITYKFPSEQVKNTYGTITLLR